MPRSLVSTPPSDPRPRTRPRRILRRRAPPHRPRASPSGPAPNHPIWRWRLSACFVTVSLMTQADRAAAAELLEQASGYVDVAAAIPAETPAMVRALVLAGLSCFADRGYVATTTRDIATSAGLSPAGMYTHFGSKAELLAEVVELSNRAVLDRLHSVDDGVGAAPDRLRTIVATLTTSLAVNNAAGRVANYEYRHLPEHLRTTIDAQRVAIRDLVAGAILAGARQGSLRVADPVAASRAIVSMCIDVCRWFGDDPDADADEL